MGGANTELEESQVSHSEADQELLHAKINQETAKTPWVDLLRFFAQGRVVFVRPGLDLVEIAAIAASNRAEELESLIAEGSIIKVSDEQAQHWLATDALLWSVVVKPWVFVQERKAASGQQLH